MTWQWLTTRASGRAHTVECDDGQTGWKLHAVVADDSETFAQIGRRPSLCGLRPKHGWGLDLFVEDKCKLCEKKAT